MEIVSHVCAEFRDRRGLILLSIGPNLIRETLVVPDAIREDPLFGLLVAEGSMKVFESREDLREFEKDPMKDIDATGKKKTTKKEAAVQASGTEVEVVPGNATEAASGKGKSNVKPEADEARV